MLTFNNRTALVTGASRGIGKAVARALARAGVAVYGTATTDEKAGVVADELRAIQPQCGGHSLRLGERDSLEALFHALAEQGREPDILVNNAGITSDALLLRMKKENWDQVLAVNLSSVYSLCKKMLRSMLRKKWGRIINVSSVVGQSGNPGQCNYAASKAGLFGFSKSLAQEVAAKGVTVNCVAPGFFQTDMTSKIDPARVLPRIPVGRLGKPEEVAATVLFLASEESGYITGETININGGLYMA